MIIFCLQLEACAHSFFDDLRDPNARLPNGQELPPLFDFTAQGNNGDKLNMIDKIKYYVIAYINF
jgi:hypothetical protein